MLLKLSCPAYITPISRACAYSIPNLELDVLVIDLYGTSPEFDSDGKIVLLSESLVSELEEQA